MKSIFFTLVLTMITTVVLSQSLSSHRIKYVIIAPDGTVGTTIYDDAKSNKIILESADAFYKYEILDMSTNEEVFSNDNKGKYCEIDKRKVAAGTYKLKLYTYDFIITSKVIVSGFKPYAKHVNNTPLVVINDD